MRKHLLLPTLLLITAFLSLLQAQIPVCLLNSKEVKFSGKAPAPWAIDGNAKDWETLLGKYSGDPANPYTPATPSGINWFMDGISGNGDADSSLPHLDLRMLSFIHDAYNTYFYFTLTHKPKGNNTFFVFIDVNADKYMNTGEPVFGVHFNDGNATGISVYSYQPNTGVDYVRGLGNYMEKRNACIADGYTMPGSLKEVFSSSNKSNFNTLNQNEVFDAAVIKSGNKDLFGVEMGIPWRFIKNWITNTAPLHSGSIFFYRTALQIDTNINRNLSGSGITIPWNSIKTRVADNVSSQENFLFNHLLQLSTSDYLPQLVSDNAGGCDGRAALSAAPDFIVGKASVETLPDGLTYRIKIPYTNQIDYISTLGIMKVTLKNVEAYAGKTVNASDFIIKVYANDDCSGHITDKEPADTYHYFDGTFTQQPIEYTRATNEAKISAPPLGTVCIVMDITLPSDGSVKSAEVEFSTESNFQLQNNCTGFLYYGGKPINPVSYKLSSASLTANSIYNKIANEVLPESLQVVVYPNPSNGITDIQLPVNAGAVDITLTDNAGRIVKRLSNITTHHLHLQNLKVGFYILKVTFLNSGKHITQKLIVQ